MRKKILTALAFATLAFVGCKKNTPNAVELSDVQISGVILAYLDYTNDTNANGVYVEESVADPVSGLRVYTVVNYEDLDETPDFGGNYKQVVISATTDANGAWTLTVPASNRPYDVEIIVDRFERNVILADNQGNNIGTELHAFDDISFWIDDVAAGSGSSIETGTRIASDDGVVNGGGNTINNGVFKLSGKVEVEYQIAAGDTDVTGGDSTIYEYPAGTVITLTAYYYENGYQHDVVLTSTIAADGSYSFDVPTASGIANPSDDAGRVYDIELFFPDLLLTYDNQRNMPFVTEPRVFFMPSCCPSTSVGSRNNGQIEINRDYEYDY